MTKNEIKYYSSLLKKKFRDAENKFLVEGKKIVSEGINSSYKCEIVIVTDQFYEEQKSFIDELENQNLRIELISNYDFNKLSDTETPQGIAAVFKKPANIKNEIENLNSRIVVVLENISDPGNAGTILRNCDWFGITEVIFSKNSADVYNPKTIRACMGSLFHLRIFVDTDLPTILPKLKKNGYKLLCADLNGKNIFDFEIEVKSLIAFANESSGPSNELLNIADATVTIPKFGNAESLNVASASAIILAEMVKEN